MEIDDFKFKTIFPEYGLMEERNDILDDLLNSKEEVEVKEEEVKEEETKPKKWWKIW